MRPYHFINFVCNPRICAGRLLVSIIFRMVVVVSRRGPGGGARVRIAEKNLCYKAAFFFQLHRCMRIFEAHRSVCSTVASSPILAVQLAERALTACNYF